LQVVETNQALRLRALRDFSDTLIILGETPQTQMIERVAGDEWLFEGPGTYIPRVEVAIVKAEVELAQLRSRQEAELTHQQALTNLEIEKAQPMSEITRTEFAQKVAALGPETVRAIAQAGPEMQARLLDRPNPPTPFPGREGGARGTQKSS